MASITSYTARMTVTEEVADQASYIDPSSVDVQSGDGTEIAPGKVTSGTLPKWSYGDLAAAGTDGAASDTWIN